VKILLIVTGSVVAFLLLAALGLALILDPMVKRVAQDKGSEALGVPVEIRDADASLFGRLSIEGLSAANPQGFQEPRAFRFDSLSAKARLRSIFEDVVEIKEVRLQRPELTIEFVGARSNLKAILDRLAEQRPKEEKDPESRKFRIGVVRIEGTELRIRSDRFAGGEPKTLTLPAIELRDLGTDEGAATVSEILATLVQTLWTEALKAAKDVIPEEVLRSLAAEIDEVGRRFGGRVQEISERARQLPGVIREKVEEKVEDQIERGLDKLRERSPRP
jgi:hypothetical protein